MHNLKASFPIFFVLTVAMLLPQPAMAYIGPGAGLSSRTGTMPKCTGVCDGPIRGRLQGLPYGMIWRSSVRHRNG